MAERVERVGEIVEAIFWTADQERELESDPRSWWPLRNRLSQAMVGLRDQLPKCAELINQHLSGQAFGVASQARNEIEIELKYLHHELERPPKQYQQDGDHYARTKTGQPVHTMDLSSC